MADELKMRPKAEEVAFNTVAKVFGDATLFDLGTKMGALGMQLMSKNGKMARWTEALPVVGGWTKYKDMGTLKRKKFRDIYAEYEKKKKQLKEGK